MQLLVLWPTRQEEGAAVPSQRVLGIGYLRLGIEMARVPLKPPCRTRGIADYQVLLEKLETGKQLATSCRVFFPIPVVERSLASTRSSLPKAAPGAVSDQDPDRDCHADLRLCPPGVKRLVSNFRAVSIVPGSCHEGREKKHQPHKPWQATRTYSALKVSQR